MLLILILKINFKKTMVRIQRSCLLVVLISFPFLATYSQVQPHVSMSDLSAEVENRLSRIDVGYPIVVTQGYIDPNNELKVNEERLRLGISKLLPNKQMKGIDRKSTSLKTSN